MDDLGCAVNHGLSSHCFHFNFCFYSSDPYEGIYKIVMLRHILLIVIIVSCSDIFYIVIDVSARSKSYIITFIF